MPNTKRTYLRRACRFITSPKVMIDQKKTFFVLIVTLILVCEFVKRVIS